jgi:hypothetical protein
MKLKFGAIVADGRGKLGGHVFSKNRAGSYMRTKVTPVNPSSTKQVESRQRLSTSAIAWRGLTAGNRLQWNAAVGAFTKTDIFGDIRKPTGFNLFCALNNNLAQVGVAQIDVPPLPVAVPSLTELTPSQVHAGATSIAFAATPTIAGFQLVIKGTSPVSAGKSFVKSEFRVVSSVAPATATPYVATADYADVFGGPGLAGQKVFFEAYYISLTTGQKGLPLQASCLVS